MSITHKRFILSSLICLSISPILAYADIEIKGRYDRLQVMNNGSVQGVRGTVENGSRGFSAFVDTKTGAYKTNYWQNLEVVGTKGQRSASKVATEISESVSKKTVFANVFKNAKAGGKFASGALGVAGWLWLAYDLVSPLLVKGGWLYDPETGNWYKAEDDDAYLVYSTNDAVRPNFSSVTPGEWKEYCSKTSNQLWIDSQLQSGPRSCKQIGIVRSSAAAQELKNSYCLGKSSFNPTGYGSLFDGFGQCLIYESRYAKKGSGEIIRIIKYLNREMTQQDFDDLIEPIADTGPTPFVDKSRSSENSEVPGLDLDGVKIPKGTVAQTNPYTNENGETEQTRWDFGQDANGNTTVTETIISRPDLEPNSPQAPNLDASTGTGTGTGTGSETDNTNTDTKPDEQPKDGLLCSLFPDILACQKMGQPDSTAFDDIKIPQVVDEKTWQPDNFLPLNGVCPQPKIFHVVGREFRVDYSPLCSFLENVRFMILLAFTVAAAYISFGGLRSDK